MKLQGKRQSEVVVMRTYVENGTVFIEEPEISNFLIFAREHLGFDSIVADDYVSDPRHTCSQCWILATGIPRYVAKRLWLIFVALLNSLIAFIFLASVLLLYDNHIQSSTSHFIHNCHIPFRLFQDSEPEAET